MNKSLIATALGLVTAMSTASSQANDFVPGANEFCLYAVDGSFTTDPAWGGTDCDEEVTGSLDPAPATGPGNALSSPQMFFVSFWTAHDIITYAPGSYRVDTIEGGIYNFTVDPGQIGASILFDWNISVDIDVINVWDVSFDGTNTTLVSTDWDRDGIPGGKMIDGPFIGSSANFDVVVQGDIRPAPEAVDDSGGSALNDETKTISLIDNDIFYPAVVVNLCGTDCGAPNLDTTAGGTLVDNADGTVDYTAPAAPFIGTDTFLYTITDDTGLTSNQATVTVAVGITNTPPVANDVEFSTNEDVALDIEITATDDNGVDVATDDDGDALTFGSFTQGSNGEVTVDATNTVLTYTPDENFNGTDSFDFVVNDGLDNSNTGTVTVTVTAVNDAPVCTDVTLGTDADTPLDIDVANDLLSTCTDAEDDPISLDSTTQPTEGGTLSFDGANTLTYTPASGFLGQDSFTYTVTDGNGGTDTRTVFVDVGKIFGNFTMLAGDGLTFGGTNDIVFTWDGTCYNSVAEANAGPENMIMGSDSNWPFFGFPWFAHDIKVYCPGGPYTIDTCNTGVTPPDCGDLTFSVPDGHLGGHMLFDWNVTADIDVAIVWNNSTGGTWENVVPGGGLYQGATGPTPAPDEFYDWISVDADGDGIPGIQFVDGPFIDFRANFNFKTTLSGGGEVEVPRSSISSPNLGSATSGCSISSTPRSVLNAGDWLVLAGFVGWLGVGINRHRRRQLNQTN